MSKPKKEITGKIAWRHLPVIILVKTRLTTLNTNMDDIRKQLKAELL
jgi:hypothetical protein